MNNPFIISAVFIAFGVALFASWWIKRNVERLIAGEKAWSRTPFGEKMLRPAGEGLRLKIEESQEEFFKVGTLLTVYVVSPIFGALITANKLSWISLGVWVIMSGLAYWLAFRQWKRLLELRQQRRNLRLGFDGERYVAEKLMPLVGMGYRIFHDMEVDWIPGKKFNIDHIAVGSNGVFVIETKTRRKRQGEISEGTESHKMKVSDGMLQFPLKMPTDEPLKQAKMNAEVLARRLAGTSKLMVPVFAVVALPGWWVEEGDPGEVRVVSGRAIASRLPGFGKEGILSEQEILRLADLLERDCRNVEG